jgi:hypothetical protein
MLLNPGLKKISPQAAISSLMGWDVFDLLAKLDLTIFPLLPAVALRVLTFQGLSGSTLLTGNLNYLSKAAI